jgi:hypothetical protein
MVAKMRASRGGLLVVCCLPWLWVAACGKDAGPPPGPAAPEVAAPSGGGAEVVPNAEATAVIGEATRLAQQTVAGADELGALTRAAAAVDRWADENPGDAGVPAAELAGATLDVMAVGAAMALDTPAAWGALEARGPTAEAVLRAAVAALGRAEAKGEGGAAAVREAAAAMLGLDPDVKDVRLERPALLALVGAARPEATAVRAAWGARLLWALDALSALPSELAGETALRTAGRLLCDRCADLHHVTPDRIARLLVDQSNAGGIVCGTAINAAAEATSPGAIVAALASCPDFQTSGGEGEPPLLWGANPAILGLLREAARVAAMEVPPGPLAGLIGRQQAALRSRLSGGWMLPAAVVDAPLAQVAGEARTTLASIDGLSAGGLSVAALPLGVVSIGPDGVRAGLRPVVAMTDAGLVSKAVGAGLPAGGRVVMSLEALSEATPAPETKAIGLIGSAAAEVAKAEDALGLDVSPKPLLAPEGTGRAITLVIDAEAKASAVVRTIDALRAAGVSQFVVEKTQGHGRVLPLLVRDAPPTLEALVPVGFYRPVIAVVRAGSVEVWGPAGDDEEAPRVGDAKKALPADLVAAYRGVDVAKLTAVGPETGGLRVADAVKAVEAIDWFLGRTGAGPVVHVVAGPDALAADVVRLADLFQARQGKRIDNPGAVWPGTSCGGEAYDRQRRPAADCPTGVAVAFSAIEPPDARGLSDTPAGNVKARPAQAAAAPAPEAAAGYCDSRSIQNGMAVRKASFRFCYERELRAKPQLEGRVAMRFTIGLDGKVSGEPKIVSSTLKDSAVEQCLIDSVKKASFDKPDGGVCSVSWPFRFEPR